MTKREILLETFDYYKSDPTRRGYSEDMGTCYYEFQGNKCAIGRMGNADFDYSFRGDVRTYSKKYPFQDHLKEEYRGHDLQFYYDLQRWHDSYLSWDSPNDKGDMVLGYTKQGHKEENELLEKYDS